MTIRPPPLITIKGCNSNKVGKEVPSDHHDYHAQQDEQQDEQPHAFTAHDYELELVTLLPSLRRGRRGQQSYQERERMIVTKHIDNKLSLGSYPPNM